MTMNPRERDLRENNNSNNNNSNKEQESYQTKLPKITTPSPSSRQWSSTFKNPRIVRVSRNFGGKDRHSKVCTVRGLRDRRIRLSVPTAIQLYDLQDRLGLSQPSKVIDWLIDATKNEIDKLPPLPMIPTNLLHYFHHPSNSIIPHEPSLLSPNLFKEREKWTSIGDEGFGHNFFPINWPYNNNNYFHSDAPILNLSQFGGGFAEQNSNNSTQASSSYMCPSESSSFPLYIAPPSLENDQFRQMNNLQNSVIMPTTLHLINPPPMKSFSLNASLHSNENEERDNGSS